MDWPPRAYIHMKVGPHGPEKTLDEILARKAREFRATGRIFWGYGGFVLHPRTQVWPFADEWVEKQGSIYLLMERLERAAKNRVPNALGATHYSENGNDWCPLPRGVATGPTHALIIDKIEPVNRELDLREYRAGIGPNAGKNALDFIKGMSDKGCLVHEGKTPDREEKLVTIAYAARLLLPYGVFLRRDEAAERG